jgi:hypothetical protein
LSVVLGQRAAPPTGCSDMRLWALTYLVPIPASAYMCTDVSPSTSTGGYHRIVSLYTLRTHARSLGRSRPTCASSRASYMSPARHVRKIVIQPSRFYTAPTIGPCTSYIYDVTVCLQARDTEFCPYLTNAPDCQHDAPIRGYGPSRHELESRRPHRCVPI